MSPHTAAICPLGGKITPVENDCLTHFFSYLSHLVSYQALLILLPEYLSEISSFLFILFAHALVQALFSCLNYFSSTKNTTCIEYLTRFTCIYI